MEEFDHQNVSDFSVTLDTNRTFELYFKHYNAVLAWMTIILTGNAFGSVANILLAITTLTYRPLRSCSSSPLIAHCAILDGIRCTLVYPGLSLVSFLAPYYAFPQILCRTTGSLNTLIVFTSNWLYCCLAVHRFCAAIFPHLYYHMTRKATIILLNLLPWMVSFLLALPGCLEINVRLAYSYPWVSCALGPPGNRSVGIILGLGTYLPCLASVLCYLPILIQTAARRRAKVGVSTALTAVRSTTTSVSVQRRYEMSRMLCVCSLWTLGMTLPFPLSMSWFPELLYRHYHAQMWVRLPQYLCSATNPIVILLVSNVYRAGFFAVLTRNMSRVSVRSGEMPFKTTGNSNGLGVLPSVHHLQRTDTRRSLVSVPDLPAVLAGKNHAPIAALTFRRRSLPAHYIITRQMSVDGCQAPLSRTLPDPLPVLHENV